MSDIIKLLPDSVANQIAAGEVIQRPASVVKELLENSIDSGADQIKLIIKDAGKTLIQVIDNGCGMSDMDARICFERHATSKISNANDLFKLKTLGFRGEALASIAAIAHVELKTKKADEEIGTKIEIQGAKLISQTPISFQNGTSFSVKNIFFNVPARRNFLKSDKVEYGHIFEELNRVVLVYPEIEFEFISDEKVVAHYLKGNTKQRVIQVGGKQFEENLLPISLQTEYVDISGYIGKADIARKTKGSQYFFANNRFIRQPYLHHAVEQAYKDLIPDATVPKYFIYLKIREDEIDVNIHPTKTEVKFQHSQILYASLRSAVKHALGMYSLSPQLNFDAETAFNTDLPKNYIPKPPTVNINPDYNPFKTSGSKPVKDPLRGNAKGWENLFSAAAGSGIADNTLDNIDNIDDKGGSESDSSEYMHNKQSANFIQINNKYIVTYLPSGIMIIDQQKAHQRILYNQIIVSKSKAITNSQKLIFPKTLHLSPSEGIILQELLPSLNEFGLEISDLGNNSFAIISVPEITKNVSVENVIDSIINMHKEGINASSTDLVQQIAHKLAISSSIKYGDTLTPEAMQSIVDKLFASPSPQLALNGSKTYAVLKNEEIETLLK